ncbi:MAG TPA: S41 family peptidase [Aggregatilineales bacterium]|nr:hypothetical protein [Anaerolineales bacterium]HRE47809.1 S41 family peptidase [Aggregatilineales bacterium]
MNVRRLWILALTLLIALYTLPAGAQEAGLALSGRFSVGYEGYDRVPLVVGLIDAAPYFGQTPLHLPAKADQAIGTTSGRASRGDYTLLVPDVLPATPFDVTGTGAPSGIRIYDVRLMSDIGKRGYMLENEDNIASSLTISIDFRVVGGTLIVFAEDANQQFPTDRGGDGVLFSVDDPRVPLSVGWQMVNLDTTPYTITPLKHDSTLNLTTTALAETIDYSRLTCPDLIPTFLDRLEQTYPFTALYGLDWSALRARLVPLSAAAATARDCEQLIREIGNFIPDGHVGWSLPTLQGEFAGSLGMVLTPLDDGRAAVSALRENGPAARAGMKIGTIIIAWDGVPMGEALAALPLFTNNGSTPHALVRIKLRDITRGTLGSKAQITFQNPGEASPVTVTLERDRPAALAGRPPIQGNLLPSGVGYVRIPNFGGTDELQAFDKSITALIEKNVPGIIIDIRSNPGGFSQVSDAMASRFFETPYIIAQQSSFDGRIVYQSQIEPRLPIYKGSVVLLVDWQTSSAGDIFAYTFQSSGRGVIVGQTPSGGLAGTVSGGQYLLPNNAFIQVPTGNFIDEEGKIVVEGTGVIPDVKVPLTVESLLSTEDVVLVAGERALLERAAP